MVLLIHDGSSFRHPGAAPIPARHDNDNWRLFPEWSTPAEFMQWVRKRKEQLRRELAADFGLRNCPEHRRTWDITHAMERCALQHFYGVGE